MSNLVKMNALNSQILTRLAQQNHEPAFLTERRLKALDLYEKLPMPGRRDEIWRRVEFGNFNQDANAAIASSDGLAKLSDAPADARSKGVFWGAPDTAAKEHAELLQK